MKIYEMKPGKELDRLIAEKFFKWQPGIKCEGTIGELPDSASGWFCEDCGATGYWGDTDHCREPKNYSTDLSCAWELVDEIMGDEKFHFGLFAEWQTKWSAEFSPWSGLDDGYFDAEGESAPHAICLAALKKS